MQNKHIKPKQNEEYQSYIDRILSSRGNIKNQQEYQQRHHIIPRCVGGSNDADNLIWLYADQHFYAHYLLFIEHPDNDKLVYAFHAMSNFLNREDRNIISFDIQAQMFRQAREAYSKCHSERMSGQGNSRYGAVVSEETRRKISAANKGKLIGQNNPQYGKTGALSCAYGRKVSDQQREKRSQSLKGKKHSAQWSKKTSIGLKKYYQFHEGAMTGKKHTDESKQKMSEAAKGRVTRKRKIKCVQSGEIFDTLKQAAQKYNVNRSNFSKVVNTHHTLGKDFDTGKPLHWIDVA